MISIDGTHCPIEEPGKEPDKKWYSHKLNAPGVAYEIAVSLATEQIVWINGPFQAGESDLSIFRMDDGLQAQMSLHTRMMAVADNGYQNEVQISTPNNLDDEATKIFKRRARARHEAVNGMLKRFDILNTRFRHSVQKHQDVFEAVCVLVQYKMDFNNGSLFQV